MSDELEDGLIARLRGIDILGPILESIILAKPELAALGITTMALNSVWKHRAELFKSEFIALNIDPVSERLASQELLNAFTATMRHVLNAASDEKIRRFARLFASFCRGLGGLRSVDQLEEYLSILDDLSDREFQLLILLERIEREHAVRPGHADVEDAMGYWSDFGGEAERTLGVTPDLLPSVLTRLQRTGLYEHFSGSYMDYQGGMGRVTTLFGEFVVELNIKKKAPHA